MQRLRQLGQNKPAAEISGDGRQAAIDAAWNGYDYDSDSYFVPLSGNTA
jgi:hypothetical protein